MLLTSSSEIFGGHGKIKICIGIRLVFEGEMPPFAVDRDKSVSHHYPLKRHTVFELLVGNAFVIGVRNLAEKI